MTTIKLYVWISLLFCSMLMSSYRLQSAAEQQDPLVGTWILSHIYPSKADTVQLKNLVVFQIENGGMTSGFMGCNRFRTECDTKGDSIFFSTLLSSRKFCNKAHMDLEDTFKYVLTNATTYTLKINTLTLYHGKKKLASFIKE